MDIVELLLFRQMGKIKHIIFLNYIWLFALILISCTNDDNVVKNQENNIIKFGISFLKSDNANIDDDVRIVLTDTLDTNIVVSSRHIHDRSGLRPYFHTKNGERIWLNDSLIINGETLFDFTDLVKCRIESVEGISKYYNIRVLESGLPVVIIDTPENIPIEDKENWLKESLISI